MINTLGDHDMYKQSVFSFANQLIQDGITDYNEIIQNKDMLIRFLTCAIENNDLNFISENNIQELLEKTNHLHQLCDDDYVPFNSEKEYGVRAYGEI